MEAYVQKLRQAIRDKGGVCSLSDLGKIPKPQGDKSVKLKAVMEKNRDIFALENTGKGSHHLVHCIKRKKHKFEDPSLKRMFQALGAMVIFYRTRVWPSERGQWESDFAEGMGLRCAASVLSALRIGGYLEVTGGKALTWKLSKIFDAVNQMPEVLKILPEQTAMSNSVIDVSRPENAEDVIDEVTEGTKAGKSWKMNDGTWCHFIDDEQNLNARIANDPYLRASGTNRVFVAVDCEGVPEALELMQIATESGVYIFDCKTVGEERVCRALAPLLVSQCHVKLMHDLHNDALALETYGQVTLRGAMDTQLVAEHVWGEPFLGFNGLLQKLELPLHPTKNFVHSKMKGGVNIWHNRPLSRNDLEYAALDVSLLRSVASPIQDLLSEAEIKDLVRASDSRASNSVANDGVRTICFDRANDFMLASADLLKNTRPSEAFFGEPLVVECEIDEVVSMLPTHLSQKLSKGTVQTSLVHRILSGKSEEHKSGQEKLPLDRLSDIVLDIGRRPQCWIDDNRVFLVDEESRHVSSNDIRSVSQKLGNYGSDNRAGQDGKLHRFSAMRTRDHQIAGITIRIGRNVRGNAAMLMDLLLGSDKSILILGEPGSGKTTIVRDATRLLAEQKNVIVVDTSNEIAGDGMIPHECIGLARRMMVPSLEQQGAVMIECVQNHTPHVMVIDEIGRPMEVQAARTVKQRGVQMIASAHGDLRKLLKNKDLRGLVGGVEYVTIGDEMARQEARRKQQAAGNHGEHIPSFPVSKTKAQRGGEPTFEIVVEVRRGTRHEWRIVTDSARAVDRILAGLRYKAQLRTRNPETGEMRMEFVDA